MTASNGVPSHSEEIASLKARIAELEAKVAILDRCNEHVECLCRGEVMEMERKSYFFETKEEADEAADNGRNTGGK